MSADERTSSADAGRDPEKGRRTFVGQGTEHGMTPGPTRVAKETLETLEQRYRLLFEHNLAGVYCTTWDGGILDCNEALARMLGYDSREEVLSHRALDLYLAPTDRKAFLARLSETGMLTNSELCLRRKDGMPIHILENVVLLRDEQGAMRIIQGTMVDITERKRAEEALRQSEQRYRLLADELRRLMQRMQSVREEERARIARELHDELGQSLTALNMDLYWLRRRAWHDSEATQSRIRSMCDLLNTTIQAVHRICADLRPTLLDDFGLAAAMEWQAGEFQARTGIRCHVCSPGTTLSLPGEQATAVFRIFQESLTNVARHAHATEVKVALEVSAGSLVLKVADNGAGISEGDASGFHSLGLMGIRERALRWGGQVEISGVPDRGTTVILRMPIEREVEPPES